MSRSNIDSLLTKLSILALFAMLAATPGDAAKVPKVVFAEEFGTVT